MHKIPREITVLAPKRLVATGQGFLGFNVQLVDVDTSRFTALCSASGPTDSGGCRLRAQAETGGWVNLIFPDTFHGDTVVNVELFDRGNGLRLRGAFTLSVQSLTESSKISLNFGGQELAGNAVNYQPIDIRGVDVKPVETVAERYRIHVPLAVQRLEDAVALTEFTQSAAPVVLSEANPLRVLDLHVGRRLIVGRCYARDLRQASTDGWARLKGADHRRPPVVDWLTVWDDNRFNRIIAALEIKGSDGPALRVENLTDYSRVSTAIRIIAGEEPLAVVEPGERQDVPIEVQQEMALAIDRGQEKCEFLRLLVEEISVGDIVIPVIRTRRCRFPWPPAERRTDDKQEVHFVGLWLPQERRELKRLLKAPDQRLWVSFPEEDGLGFQIDWDPTLKELAVASTVNLRESLNGA